MSKRFVFLFVTLFLLAIISGVALARTYTLTGNAIGYQRYTLVTGDRLNVVNCSITNGGLVVRGSGAVSISKLSVYNPGGVGVSLTMNGPITIYHLTIYGPGVEDPIRPSGLTIHGATSADIRYVSISGMAGNGVLVESIDRVCSNIRLRDVSVVNCLGGVWFCNAFNCSLRDLTSVNSDYTPPGPRHAAGLVYPCVIDEKVNPSDPEGNMLRGTTEFLGTISCN